MISKRGQVTLYVIIAIIVVVSAALLWTFRGTIFKPALSAEEAQKLVSSQVQPLKDNIQGCMEIVARKTINTMGRGGGYIYPKSERISIPSSVMPDAPIMTYALIKEDGEYKNLLPSMNEMKAEFLEFMSKNPDYALCIDDFSLFRQSLNVQAGSMEIMEDKIEFGENNGQIIIPFKHPVTISLGNASASIDNYAVRIPINLQRIHENAAAITNEIASGKNYVVLLQDMAKQQEQELRANPDGEKLFVTASYYDFPTLELNETAKTNTLFKMTYENPSLDTPYEFYFLTGEE